MVSVDMLHTFERAGIMHGFTNVSMEQNATRFRSFVHWLPAGVPSRIVLLIVLRAQSTRTVYCVEQETERRVISARPDLGVP